MYKGAQFMGRVQKLTYKCIVILVAVHDVTKPIISS